MRCFFYIILTLQCFFQAKLCLSQVIEEWRAHYVGPGGADALLSMCIDRQSNVYITGSSDNTINSADYATVKYSASGVQLWTARYGGQPNRGATAFSVAADRFGNAYVTGFAPVSSSGPSKFTTIKYNQSGIECWVRIYYGQVYSAGNTPYSITTDYDANVYVTGGSFFDTTGYDYTTIKYDSSGTEQWVARYRNQGQDWPYYVKVDDSGNVYVTGCCWDETTEYDIATVKYNSSGIQQWASIYNGPGNRGDSATGLALDNQGNVYVTGRSWGGDSTGYDYITIKYNGWGVQQWACRYDGLGNYTDISNSIAVDDSGDVYVTGETHITSNDIRYATIKYNLSGEQQWVALYQHQGGDFGKSIAVDNSGGIYVTGESWGGLFGTRDDFATVKYSAAGVQQWVIRTSGSVDEVPRKIAVDSLGNVYVSGVDGHYLTIKYNQATGIKPVSNKIPKVYKLYQNHPNPFNPKSNIEYQIPKSSLVSLKVFDILGREVSEPVNSKQEAGTYQITFDASSLASGIYFYSLTADGLLIDTKKMVLVK